MASPTATAAKVKAHSKPKKADGVIEVRCRAVYYKAEWDGVVRLGPAIHCADLIELLQTKLYTATGFVTYVPQKIEISSKGKGNAVATSVYESEADMTRWSGQTIATSGLTNSGQLTIIF